MIRLGNVSFLNSRPLVEGLTRQPDVRLIEAVPSALAELLETGQVDAALIPVIDLAREQERRGWQRVSDACIASDGPTMTVRVFSRVPPARMRMLAADNDSHTSVVLARVLWRRYYGQAVEVVPRSALREERSAESVLLIGDKVVTAAPEGYDHQVDLGAAWREWTGLPFVFAVWAAPATQADPLLEQLLNDARDRGVRRAAELAAIEGPKHGWPVALAREYLTQRLMYTVTPRAQEGMQRFVAMAADEGLVTPAAERIG
jgi:chorismate dehydratase